MITLYLKHLANNKIAVHIEYVVLHQYVAYVPLKIVSFSLSLVLISETTVFSEM